MDATINTNNGNDQSFSMQQDNSKSDLMQFFEKQVSDMYWAQKDLLKAIFESED